MKFVAIVLLATFGTALYAQTIAHANGMAHSEQMDIAYQTLGSRGTALPIVAVNGGPGLTHAYMVQNDLWDRVAKRRMVVFYDQRGTGSSKPSQHQRYRKQWTRRWRTWKQCGRLWVWTSSHCLAIPTADWL